MSKDNATIANLNRLLEIERQQVAERDETIGELQEKVYNYERQLDNDAVLVWRVRKWEAGALPVPRIELRWSLTGRLEATALLVLVYRHLLDNVEAVVLGHTRCSGSSYDEDRGPGMFLSGDGLSTPFRDGVHLTHNAKHLGLRAFITTEDGDATEIDPETRVQTWISRAEVA